ncbi:hypothetical protein WIMU106979_18550 [Williamsia muralis]
MFRGVGVELFQLGEQLIDLLMLTFDLEGERLPVGQFGADDGPQHRFLREGVGEHQLAEAVDEVLTLRSGRLVDGVQQSVEFDVVAFLAYQHTPGPAQLGLGLVGNGSGHGRSWSDMDCSTREYPGNVLSISETEPTQNRYFAA